MKKIKILLFVLGLLITFGIVSYFYCSNEYFLLTATFAVLGFFGAIFVVLQKQNSNQQIIVELSNMPNIWKKILSILPVVIIFLSVSLIPAKFFFIVAVILLICFAIPLFIPKRLAINHNGIRYIFRWNLKWDNIKSYSFDKENRILYIYTKNNEIRQIIDVNENTYSIISKNIDSYLKSNTLQV
jgi:hypothetical protein